MEEVLKSFGLFPTEFSIERIGAGHIHQTYKLKGKEKSFILQRINQNVFRNPEIIVSNLKLASDHLSRNFPGYFFFAFHSRD